MMINMQALIVMCTLFIISEMGKTPEENTSTNATDSTVATASTTVPMTEEQQRMWNEVNEANLGHITTENLLKVFIKYFRGSQQMVYAWLGQHQEPFIVTDRDFIAVWDYVSSYIPPDFNNPVKED